MEKVKYIIKQKKVEYEGEIINGIKNGIGKEYDSVDGKILFVGEYSKGKRKKGKEYQDGELRFEGE